MCSLQLWVDAVWGTELLTWKCLSMREEGRLSIFLVILILLKLSVFSYPLLPPFFPLKVSFSFLLSSSVAYGGILGLFALK